MCSLPESGLDLFIFLSRYKLDHDLLPFENLRRSHRSQESLSAHNTPTFLGYTPVGFRFACRGSSVD